MTGDQILEAKDPAELFPGDEAEAKAKYLQLAQKHHPDHGGDPDVFAHLAEMYRKALAQLQAGTFAGKATFLFEAHDGKKFEIQYLTSKPFELGQMYVGDHHVTYIVDEPFRDLFENAVAHTSLYKFKDDKMREECARYLPQKVKTLRGMDGRRLMHVPKTPDLLLLRDVIDHFSGKMDPRHAAWTGSTLHNLACYLEWAGIVHANISPDTYFISPQYHSGALLGGWWYAQRAGRKITDLPARSFDYLPWEVRTKKLAIPELDQELVRATIRECLGDVTGARLKDPEKLVNWLRMPASGKGVEIYKDWYGALEGTFGKRKFTKLELESQQLYNHNARS